MNKATAFPHFLYLKKADCIMCPLLEIVIDPHPLVAGDPELPHEEAADIAAKCGRRLLTNEELHYLFAFRRELNEILEAHNMPLFDDYYWSGTELSDHFAWYMNFRNGYTATTIKTDTHKFRVAIDFKE